MRPQEKPFSSKGLGSLLRPKSVAIIGATPRENSFGNNLIGSVDSLGFQGKVHLVNPRYDTIGGRPCYRDIASIQDSVDCAVMGLGDGGIVAGLETIAAAGVPAAVLFSRAFGDEPNGVSRQDAIRAIARSTGMAVCGANCMGFVNLIDKLQITGLPFRSLSAPSGIAVISHSGSTWSGLVGNQRQLGFDFAISAGQELATTVSDYVHYLLEQTETRVIACVLETLRDPEGFIAAAKIALKKRVPIIVLKLGRSEASKSFAISHSGAISGSNAAYEALFAKYGIIEVRSLDEMLNTAELLAAKRPMSVDGIALGTDSGGERQLIVDLAADINLPFVSLLPETKAKIERHLDPGMEASNPLDYWGDGSDVMAPCLAAMAEDEGVGMVVMATNLAPDRPFAEMCFTAITTVHEATTKPVVLMGNLATTMSPVVSRRLREKGIPVLMGTETALAAIKHMREYAFGEYLEGAASDPAKPASEVPASEVIDKIVGSATSTLPSVLGFGILAAYGIASPHYRSVASPDDVARFGEMYGFPLVLKIDDPAIPHKSDVGGVRIGLGDATAAFEAYRDLKALHASAPILVQTQSAGVEFILGMTRDPDFGPIVTLGLGGVFTEIFKDATALMPPITEAGALTALKGLKGFPLLTGARGGAPADLDALCATIARFSRLVLELSPYLEEIEINPLMVSPSGAMAVDCLAVRQKEKNNA